MKSVFYLFAVYIATLIIFFAIIYLSAVSLHSAFLPITSLLLLWLVYYIKKIY